MKARTPREAAVPSPFPQLPPEQRGELTIVRHASTALRDNFWGDPAERDVYVYTPVGATDPLPSMLVLPGYAGTGEGMLARGLSSVSFATRLDRLFAEGCPKFRAILPDVMTRLGGSQYVDSPGIGNYATWLARELPAFIDARFPTTRRWGVVGRSSGGFGALHLALTFPGVFAAAGSHAGDLGFDVCYLGDVVGAVRGVQAAGGLDRFLDAFWVKEDPGGNDFSALNFLCMACAYAPDATRRPFPAVLPVDFVTGAFNADKMRAWQAFDPLHRDLAPLRALDALFLDAGNRDEHLLHLGARRLVSRLESEQIPHRYEEFSGGHRGTSYRYDVSLPWLAAALHRRG
jgi:S-formylglutathione hydrolase FrmB